MRGLNPLSSEFSKRIKVIVLPLSAFCESAFGNFACLHTGKSSVDFDAGEGCGVAAAAGLEGF
jgi:hypothetical protein